MPGLLALLAHPDDEFFCGGLLAAASARGVPVHLVYWTRGEGGGSPRSRFFWKWFPRRWHPRSREAARVAAFLPAASLDFLGAIEPAPDPEPRTPEEGKSAGKLVRLLAFHAPEIVLTHGSDGDYGHPAHRRLHEMARKLCAGSKMALISFNATWPEAPSAQFLNPHDPANFVFDASPWLKKKREIVLAHRSQRGALESLADGTLEGLLAVSRYEGYRCWTGKEAALNWLRRLTG